MSNRKKSRPAKRPLIKASQQRRPAKPIAGPITAESLRAESQRQFDIAASGPPEAIQEHLVAGIEAALKSHSLWQVDFAENRRRYDQITQEEYQAEVDQALDSYNNVDKDIRDEVAPSASPAFIYGLDGELIWLGE